MEEVLFSSKSNEWENPQEFYDELNREFNFTLDPCCQEHNHKCDKYYTVQQDGLSKSWAGETVFCNPPYGRSIGKWVEKCYEEHLKGTVVVMLIPSRTDTTWFHKYILGKAEIRFVKGRMRFINRERPETRGLAPFPSMVVVYRKS